MTRPNGTTVDGTGGSDDFTPTEIGFPGECPAVSVPGGVDCQAPTGDLGALVGCIDCASESRVDCLDALAAPDLKSYPAECGPAPSGTLTPTPTPTATP